MWPGTAVRRRRIPTVLPGPRRTVIYLITYTQRRSRRRTNFPLDVITSIRKSKVYYMSTSPAASAASAASAAPVAAARGRVPGGRFSAIVPAKSNLSSMFKEKTYDELIDNYSEYVTSVESLKRCDSTCESMFKGIDTLAQKIYADIELTEPDIASKIDKLAELLDRLQIFYEKYLSERRKVANNAYASLSPNENYSERTPRKNRTAARKSKRRSTRKRRSRR